jgi:hypothetical protein
MSPHAAGSFQVVRNATAAGPPGAAQARRTSTDSALLEAAGGGGSSLVVVRFPNMFRSVRPMICRSTANAKVAFERTTAARSRGHRPQRHGPSCSGLLGGAHQTHSSVTERTMGAPPLASPSMTPVSCVGGWPQYHGSGRPEASSTRNAASRTTRGTEASFVTSISTLSIPVDRPALTSNPTSPWSRNTASAPGLRSATW